MAALQAVPSSTVKAIYDALVDANAKRHSYDSVGLSMSDLGSECDRALWYSLRWASEREQPDGRTLRRFATGNITEDRIITELREAGITVVDIDHDTGKQIKVYSHGGHVRGYLDGKVYGLPEAPKTWHVLECKALQAKRFNAIVKKGLKEAERTHWLQCQKYMELTGLGRALYIVSNTDNDELYGERVGYDGVEIAKLNARLDRIIGQTRAPPRVADAPDKWPCVLCRHKAVCHRDAFGRVHCRTCLNSTPIMTDGDTSATWTCDKFGVTLSIDDQRAGHECPAHRFLPDMVPGEQTDVTDDGGVVYTMRDGSTWIDQEKKESGE